MTLKSTNAEITVHSIQKGGGESLMVDRCRLVEKDGKIFLFYEERPIDDLPGSSVRVRVEEDAVVVKRSGEVEARLEYAKGRATATNYRVPYGMIHVDIYTNDIRIERRERYLSVELDFYIDIGMEKSENLLKITVKEDTTDDIGGKGEDAAL